MSILCKRFLPLLVLSLATAAAAVDRDHDGLSDELEQALLDRFQPRFMVSAGECDQRPAAFQADAAHPVLVARDGTIYGQAFPRNAAALPGVSVELHYYHLWSRDCGRQGHPLDAEHVSALVTAASLDEPAANWRAHAWYAAAHEDTLCDVSRWTRASAIGADNRGASVWISAGKHASFLSEELCHGGCGDDTCRGAKALTSAAVVNLGEPGAPLNGALWAASSRWPLAQKMASDFSDATLAALASTDSLQRAHSGSAQAVVLGGADALDALATGGRQTANGLSSAKSHTATSLARAANATRDFLAGASPQPGQAQTQQPAPPQRPIGPREPTHADILRGEYGRYRANNDLLYYHLDVRVDPEKKYLSGKVTTRFKMLQDDNRIQLDLYPNLNVDKILLGDTALKYERDAGAVFVDFPETLRAGKTYSIDFYYSGSPQETGRFGGIAFRKDPAGRPWINTACEGEGASIWWPNKDQWRDEVENMDISVSIPNDLVDVSNGRFVGKTDLGDGYTRWDWHVSYPINNYDVSLNIGKYEHWDTRLGGLRLDFYALPEDLEKAHKQFPQANGMIEAFQHYFGEYPFKKDGYKLIEAPYSGMEHQSAVTYGNHFANGYLERDWTGVGISPRFDFIIIHESGHEWFGNAITAADRSDMWIHEGWTTYLECLYVEYHYGHDDYLKYTNGYKSKVQNRQPIIAARNVNATPPQDQYFKGALFLNTLRSVVNDDKRWFKLLHDLFQHFKYRNIMTEDMVAYFNQQLGINLTPVFDQYLRRTAIPTLELQFDDAKGTVAYRWKVDEPAFKMPVRVGKKDAWQIVTPTTEWQTMPSSLKKDEFEVATDLYFVNVAKN